MLNIINFSAGDMITTTVPDIDNPMAKVVRKGLINKVNKTTLLIQWFPDKNSTASLYQNLKVLMLTKTMRSLIMNGSIKHFPKS